MQVAAAIDFTTKALLQEALKRTEYDRLRGKDGKASGLLGWWGERAVTFIEASPGGRTLGSILTFFVFFNTSSTVRLPPFFSTRRENILAS